MSRPKFSVESMTEGEILVRGTLDPQVALKLVFEHADELYEIDDLMAGSARPREGFSDPELDPEAVATLAEWCHEALASAIPRYWRKVCCGPNTYEFRDGYSWMLHPALKGEYGAFPAVEFP